MRKRTVHDERNVGQYEARQQKENLSLWFDANALSLGFQPLPLLINLKPLNRHRLYGKMPVFSARRPSWSQKRVTEQLPHFLPLHATYRDSILIKTFSISLSSLEEAAPSSSITPAIPNLKWRRIRRRLFYFGRRKIKVGEELTVATLMRSAETTNYLPLRRTRLLRHDLIILTR